MGATGATGSTGPAGLNWRGTWSSSTAYAVNDAVAYNGSSYTSIQAGTNQQPDISASFWSLLAQQGTPGPSTVSYTSNGSTANLLQKLTTVLSVSRAVNATTSDATGIIGIASTTVSAGSSVLVNVYGTALCVFDGATTAGDYVQASATVAGNCHDVGASYPPANQVLGYVLSSNSTAGTHTLFLFGIETGTAAPAISSVFGRTGAVTAAANDYNFNQLAGSLASSQDYTVGSAGTYTKVTTNAQGRVSSGTQAAASDLSNGITGSGLVVLATGPTLTTPTISGALGGNLDLGTANAVVIEVANASVTGTTVNKLVKLTGAPSTAVTAATTDTSRILGIVTGGAGTTGNAQIATDGIASCVFDGATTAGDYVQISSVLAGDCHDAGSTRPTSGQVLGMVLSTHGTGGTYAMTVVADHMGVPTPSGGTIATSETTISSTYTDLTTSGPAVTVAVSAVGKALVTVTSTQNTSSNFANCFMGFAVSGATTASASDSQAQQMTFYRPALPVTNSATYLVTGLATGNNTFTAKYRSGNADCSFANRNIMVTSY